jgi:hypothetical protein
MDTVQLCVALMGGLLLSWPLLGQTPGANIERQLQSQYRTASVSSDGTVVRPGTLLVVAQDGIKANPPSGDIYWYNSHKPGNRIGYSKVFESFAGDLSSQVRLLEVGEKVLVTRIRAKPSEVDFYVQTYVDNPNDVPYRACVLFQFQKGFVESDNLKAIQDSINEVFTPDTSSTTAGSETPSDKAGKEVKPAEAALNLPATYVNAQAPTDQLQLNADDSFRLEEAGQTYRGTFVVSGNTLELSISPDNKPSATLKGTDLIDSSGQTWVLQKPSAGPEPGADMLRNEGVIRMVKEGLNDLFIIARINGSKCQFDTSTDALIRLKQGGVSAAVIKAILTVGK